MPVLAWRPENERAAARPADSRQGSMHAGETIVCASALLPSVTTPREANPKAASQDSIKRIHGMRNPCHIASAQGGLSPFCLWHSLKREVQVPLAEFHQSDVMSGLTAPLFHLFVRSSA
jgi:hypothetical protein